MGIPEYPELESTTRIKSSSWLCTGQSQKEGAAEAWALCTRGTGLSLSCPSTWALFCCSLLGYHCWVYMWFFGDEDFASFQQFWGRQDPSLMLSMVGCP